MKKEKTKSREFIFCGSLMMFLKSTATFFAHSMPVFYTIQLNQAFGFGMLIVAQAYYVNEIMEEESKFVRK